MTYSIRPRWQRATLGTVVTTFSMTMLGLLAYGAFNRMPMTSCTNPFVNVAEYAVLLIEFGILLTFGVAILHDSATNPQSLND